MVDRFSQFEGGKRGRLLTRVVGYSNPRTIAATLAGVAGKAGTASGPN
jgi:hypothetical protein